MYGYFELRHMLHKFFRHQNILFDMQVRILPSKQPHLYHWMRPIQVQEQVEP